MTLSGFKAIGKSPLTTIVYENIKQAIISGKVKPGTRLTEASVSEQLEVSSTPVREAFRRLESERLVEIIPYRGAVVQEFSTKEVEEVYQCRSSLEVLAIELAVDNMDEEGIEKLQELIEQSKMEKDHAEYVKINSTFHNTIMSYAKNDTLKNLLHQIHDIFYHNRNFAPVNPERKKEISEEYVRIVQALIDGDKEKASQATSDHVLNDYEYIKQEVEKIKIKPK